MKNRSGINFQTNLKCQLTDFIRFKDQTKIVPTWEFNMEHHLGKDVHLNQLYDFDIKNKNHPSGYFFILEQIGDRKGRILINIDKHFFHGYLPSQVHIEFDFKIGFLYKLTGQIKIFNKFFNNEMSFKKPKPRIIYSLVDIQGLSGKSLF
jgi:hypothetical protein